MSGAKPPVEGELRAELRLIIDGPHMSAADLDKTTSEVLAAIERYMASEHAAYEALEARCREGWGMAGANAASEELALAESATLRQRLATAEAVGNEWRDRHTGAAHHGQEWRKAASAALADAAALRERVTRAEALLAEIARPNGVLCRTCGDMTETCNADINPGDECPGKLARAFLAPTEPDGASEAKETP